MRFGWLAAAAAMALGAGHASAETITQGFVSTFLPNGSSGPISIGALNLGTSRAIRSATVFYDARVFASSGYAGAPGASISYAGNVGFTIETLPIPISASNAFSGTQDCQPSVCELNFQLMGSLAVPQGDFATFAGNTPLIIFPTGSITYTVSYNGGPVLPTQQVRGSGVQGRIVYDVIAVPEPASWALMIVGVGVVGGSMRRRRFVAQAA